jgi:hypothetical protein
VCQFSAWLCFRLDDPEVQAANEKQNKAPLVKTVWGILVKHYGKDPTKGEEGDFGKLAYPEIFKWELVSKLRSSFFTLCGKAAAENRDGNWLSEAMQQIPEHWAEGPCTGCAPFWGDTCPCHAFPALHGGKYAKGGATHLAIRKFFRERFTPKKMQPFTYADANYLSECFHAALLRWAPKRICFTTSMDARVGMATLDWNENAMRPIRGVYRRKIRATEFHKRTGCSRRLVAKTSYWKYDIALNMGFYNICY